MPFVVFAWIASFFYGLVVIVSKLTTKHAIKNPWMFEFFWELFTLLFLLPIALFSGVGFPQNWGTILIAGFTYAVSGTMYVLALYRLDASVIGPMYTFRTPMSVLLGVFIAKEFLTAEQLVLICIITIAGIFVSFDERMRLRSFFQPNIGFALLAVFAAAVMGLAVNRALGANGYWEATLWISIVGQVFLLGLIPLFIKDFRTTKPAAYSGIAISSMVFVIGLLAFNRAIAENISITTAILSLPLSLIIIFILSRVAPQLLEKHTAQVYMIRLIAALVMVGAALRLSL